MSWLQALLMSALVYSGSAQMAALQSWSASPLLAPLIAAVLVMNARYILYGAAMRPFLAGASPTQAYGSLFFLGDGNWALSMNQFAAGERDGGIVLGSGVAMFLPWCIGTLAGVAMGGMVPDPATFGLDFMLVAFAAAIAAGLWRGHGDWYPAVAAAATALLLHHWLPGGWYIVGAGLAGAMVGAWRNDA